jgi:hypothetical protein
MTISLRLLSALPLLGAATVLLAAVSTPAAAYCDYGNCYQPPRYHQQYYHAHRDYEYKRRYYNNDANYGHSGYNGYHQGYSNEGY